MRLLWEEEAWEAKRLLSADSSLFVMHYGEINTPRPEPLSSYR